MLRIITGSLVTAAIGLSFLQFTSIKQGNHLSATIVDSSAVEKNYVSFCGGCHGEKMNAFVDRSWKHGSSREDLFKAIKFGYTNEGMPGFDTTFTDEETYQLADYIITGINDRKRYDFTEPVKTNFFPSEKINIKLDTVAKDIKSPWAMAFLPNGDMLFTEKYGKLYRVDKNKQRTEITGVPKVIADGQGGLMDIVLHPSFQQNNTLYLSYSKQNKDTPSLATTAIVKATLVGNKLEDVKEIFEALPYAPTRHHYGSRMVFGKDGYLYFSVGERGNEKQNPQSIKNDLGKIHRIKDDGSIPADNPFVGNDTAKASIYTYGNRNPQGLTIDDKTGIIWEHEHGPRGGDEINIIGKGNNYGWPAISYGINYNNTIITDKTALPGMEQPLIYWLPSIGPSGMAFVNSNRYKAWNGNLLVGSLRFRYLDRCVIKEGKVVHQEMLLKNIGRVRDVRMAPDGFIYVSVENPGYIFRLMPVSPGKK